MKPLLNPWNTTIRVVATVVAISAAAPATAGKLDSFENSVGGSPSGSSSSDSGSSSDDSGSLSSFETSTSSKKKKDAASSPRIHPYYIDCWYCRFSHHCLFHHSSRYHGYRIHAVPSGVAPSPDRTNVVEGIRFELPEDSPLLPVARLDGSWQAVEDDVDAYDFALEVGYSALAVRGRMTQYRENDPDDTLDLSSILLLWRAPLSRDLEVDAGLGGAELKGNQSQSGLDVSLALRGWIPDRRLGYEYRGEFMDIGNGLNSNELAVLLHVKQFAVRGGYRWLHTTGNSLDGPFIGAALSF